MTKINVNFEELVHMDLEEAKKIVSHFDNEVWYEELGATVNGAEYRLSTLAYQYLLTHESFS